MKTILSLLGAVCLPVAMLQAAEEKPNSSPGDATPQSPAVPPPTQPATKPAASAISTLQAQWDLLKDLDGEAFLSKAVELGLVDVKVQALYQNFLNDQRQAGQLKTSGLGENHPEIQSLRAGLDAQRRQLMAAAAQIKENVQQKLMIERQTASRISLFHLTADQASRFQWGEPSDGLRLALARPEAVGEKDSGQLLDLRMVIQNVSDKAVRLNLAQSAEHSPRLNLRMDGRTIMEFTGERWDSAEILLPPDTAVSLRPFASRVTGAVMRVDDPSLAFSVELHLLPAPGTWSGRLTSADTIGLASSR